MRSQVFTFQIDTTVAGQCPFEFLLFLVHVVCQYQQERYFISGVNTIMILQEITVNLQVGRQMWQETFKIS